MGIYEEFVIDIVEPALISMYPTLQLRLDFGRWLRKLWKDRSSYGLSSCQGKGNYCWKRNINKV